MTRRPYEAPAARFLCKQWDWDGLTPRLRVCFDAPTDAPEPYRVNISVRWGIDFGYDPPALRYFPWAIV